MSEIDNPTWELHSMGFIPPIIPCNYSEQTAMQQRSRQLLGTVINLDDIKELEFLGVNTERIVKLQYGKYKDIIVVVKSCSKVVPENEHYAQELRNEQKILSLLESSYVVQMIGISAPISIVMEHLDTSLFLAIRDKRLKVEWKTRVGMALSIAKGLQYLHNKDILHYDFKTGNILLKENGHCCKIADFGQSYKDDPNVQQEKCWRGTTQFNAPEVFTTKQCTKASDIYSLSIVLWELAKLENVYSTAVNIDAIKNYVIAHKRPKTDNIEEEYKNLIEECWKHVPTLRPTIDDAVQKLQAINNRVC